MNTDTIKAPRAGTHIAKVRDYLAAGRALTHAEAFTNFGTMRLASCIEELRNKYGFKGIVTETKTNPVTGATYASYRMAPELAVRDRVEVISLAASKKDGWISDDGSQFYAVGDRGRVTEVRDDGGVRVQFAKLRATGRFRHGNGDWYLSSADLKILAKDTV